MVLCCLLQEYEFDLEVDEADGEEEGGDAMDQE